MPLFFYYKRKICSSTSMPNTRSSFLLTFLVVVTASHLCDVDVVLLRRSVRRPAYAPFLLLPFRRFFFFFYFLHCCRHVSFSPFICRNRKKWRAPLTRSLFLLLFAVVAALVILLLSLVLSTLWPILLQLCYYSCYYFSCGSSYCCCGFRVRSDTFFYFLLLTATAVACCRLRIFLRRVMHSLVSTMTMLLFSISPSPSIFTSSYCCCYKYCCGCRRRWAFLFLFLIPRCYYGISHFYVAFYGRQ